MRPHSQQPTRLPRPWDSPGKNTGVGCHFLLQCMKVRSESEVAQSSLFGTPWTVAHQAPPPMGFSRQEYWSGLPSPTPVGHLDPGIKTVSLKSPALAGRSFTTAAAAVNLLQSCPTLCNPIDGSPPGSPVPGILQARTLEWAAISFSNA